MARLRFWVVLALFVGIIGPIVRGELSEEEKKKREAFLKAREEMRTVASPTPSASPKKKAKPKAATHPPKKKKKTTKPKPTAEEEEETPKKSKSKETPEPEETPKHKAKKSPTPKPKTTPKKEKEEEEETPKPKPKPIDTPEQPSPIPRESIFPTPASEQPADVVVEKSGFQETEEVSPEPTPEEHRFLFWKWNSRGSGGNYRYLTRSVRSQIDRARVLRRRWQFIVVHNSGTRQGNARIFDYYHRHVRRMKNGLAYHFVIGNGTSSDNGEIEVGDRWRRQINGGHVHSDYLNNIALGICLVGDFNRDQPTRAQLEACEELIRYLRQRCGKIDAHYAIVKPHREMNPPRWATDCPGDAFPYSWFRRFRE
jgi:hypothetical protein